jgi:hypothetical protein
MASRLLAATDDDDVTKRPPARVGNAFDHVQQVRAYDHHCGPRIADHILVVCGLPQRVERHRDRADLDGAEKRRDELRAVEQQEEHPIFRPYADAPQRVAAAVHMAQHIVVGEPNVATLDGNMPASSFGNVAIDEM